jgi:MATE family multidrug resistance protein
LSTPTSPPTDDDAPPPPSDEGGVRREIGHIAPLAAPIALAQLGLVLMGLVDTAILGRVSVDDLAAASIGRSLAFATGSIGMGLASAIEPLASQAIGAGDRARAWAALRSSLTACALAWLPSAAIAVACTELLVPLGVDGALVPRVRAFLVGQLPGIFAFNAYLCAKSFLQAHGDTRPALVGSVVANVINVVVCSLLVRGDDALAWVGLPGVGLPRLGALGAGLATGFGAFVFLAVVLVAARRHRASAPWELVPIRQVFRLGVPLGSQLLAEIGVFALVALLAGRLGAVVVSAHQVAIGLASFTFMGALGVSGATAVRVGHAVGAGRSPLRAGQIGIALGAAVMTVGALVFAALPGALMRLFTDDAEVIALGSGLLYIAAIFQLVDGVQVVAAGALRGAGDVRFPFLANVAAHWLIGMPVALLLGFGLGLGAPGLWWGLTAGLVSVAVMLTARFLYLARRPIARL